MWLITKITALLIIFRLIPQPVCSFRPSEYGMIREASESQVTLTSQVDIPPGKFWFGTQMQVGEKLVAYKSK